MQQMGVGYAGFGYTAPTQQQYNQLQKRVDPVIDGVSGWGHVGLGAVIGLAAGYFLFKK
jgi:uncharacterized membrane protein (Fun14 family)